MQSIPVNDRAGDEQPFLKVPIVLLLLCLGLAGNYFRYYFLFDIQFIFGSIFAMLVLQLFGSRWGVPAAGIISLFTYLLWNHPYAIIIMTAEVYVAGMLVERRKIDLVSADALYWLCIGIPLVFLLYSGAMHLPLYHAGVTSMKQAVNGIANALVARLLFMVFSAHTGKKRFALQEVLFNVLAFFVLAASLFLLINQGRTEQVNTDQSIRGSLNLAKQRMTANLDTQLAANVRVIAYLAGIASSRSLQAIQQSMEQARAMNEDFHRIGFLDRSATVIAFSPPVDDLGRPHIGRNYADRPFIALLKRGLKPMLTDVEMSRFGTPRPRVGIVAPVMKQGAYAGFVIGVLDLDRLREPLALNARSQITQDLLFTLVDRNNRVILSTREELRAMEPFSRGAGELRYLGDGISQWLPAKKKSVPLSERWKNSFYSTEQLIGSGSAWKLILEQPVAPFQRKLFEKYAAYLTEIFIVLLITLALARYLSRSAAKPLKLLAHVSASMPSSLPSVEKLTWPESTITETSDLIHSFRDMAQVMALQFHTITMQNESLEQRIHERTQELQESEERYRALIESTSDWIWEVDRNGRYRYSSPRVRELLGYAPEEIIGKTPFELMPPEEARRVEEEFSARIRARQPLLGVENINLHKDGHPVVLETSGVPIIDAEGRMLGYRGIDRDITERTRAEEALRRGEAELKEAQSIARLGRWSLNLLDNSLQWSDTIYELFELDKTKFGATYEAFLEAVHPDDREMVNKGYTDSLSDKRPYEITHRLLMKDGRVKWVHEICRTDYDLQGRPVRSVGTVQDITALRNAEEKIRQLANELQTILNTVAVGVAFAKDRKLIWTNPAFDRIFGYNTGEARGIEARLLYVHPADYERVGREGYPVINAGDVYTTEVMSARKDGGAFWLSLSGRTVNTSDSSEGSIWMMQDVTERKQVELELRDKTRQLEALTRDLESRVEQEVALRRSNEQMLVQQSKLAAMGEMLGAIAHQWRQPLNTLGLIIQNLKDAHSFGELNKDCIEQTVQKSMSQIRHMSKTIDDFRTFFLPDKERSAFDTMKAVGDVLSLFSAQLSANNIDFQLTCRTHRKTFTRVEDIVPCEEKIVTGFRNEFEHVIMNLINNAREAIVERRERGDMQEHERGRISFDFENTGGKILIEVSDNGGGIPEEVIGRVFEPYFTTKDPAKGTGLGLYMSTVIVKDHMQGRLTVKNSGQGAVFTVELPQA